MEPLRNDQGTSVESSGNIWLQETSEETLEEYLVTSDEMFRELQKSVKGTSRKIFRGLWGNVRGASRECSGYVLWTCG